MIRLPLRWSGAMPKGDLAPLNCLYGGGEGMPVLTAEDLQGVQIPKNALWPSVRVTRRGGEEAGPTGLPWVNANGWQIRMLQFRDATRPVLVDVKPDAGARAGSYVLAAAEAMGYGGAPVVTYTPESWPAVQAAMRFFLVHAAWWAWEPVAELAIVSEFAGDDEAAAGECLNLLTRRQVGFRLALPGDVEGLAKVQAAAWVSKKPVPMEKYLGWIRGGGTLIVHGKGAVRNEGKGRIVERTEPWEDYYAAAAGIHLTLTRKLDTIRMWNAGSVNSFYQVEPGGRRAVVQLLNYGNSRGAEAASLWLARPWRKATLTTFEGQTALKTVAANGGIEVALPPLGVYAAMELEA